MVSGSFGGSWNGLFFTQTPFFCFYCAFPFLGLSRTENRLAERDFSSGAEWWWVVDILCRKCPSGDEWKGFKYLVNLYLPRKTVLEWNGRKKGKCLQGWRAREFLPYGAGRRETKWQPKGETAFFPGFPDGARIAWNLPRRIFPGLRAAFRMKMTKCQKRIGVCRRMSFRLQRSTADGSQEGLIYIRKRILPVIPRISWRFICFFQPSLVFLPLYSCVPIFHGEDGWFQCRDKDGKSLRRAWRKEVVLGTDGGSWASRSTIYWEKAFTCVLSWAYQNLASSQFGQDKATVDVLGMCFIRIPLYLVYSPYY